MIIARGFRYKLEPLPEQEALFRQFAGVCRLVYDLGLEQKATRGAEAPPRLRCPGRRSDAPEGRVQLGARRFRVVPTAGSAHLDRAFGNFFAGRVSFPRTRKRGVDDSFRFPGREVAVKRLNANWSAVRLPKIGWVKYRDSRPIRGVVKNVTILLDPLGWPIAFTCEIAHDAPAPSSEVVGIDRGVVTTLALSTGEMPTMPASPERIELQERRAQARVARLQARQARIRRDFHHRAALDIARRFGVAVLEDLTTRGMTASARGTIVEPGRNVRQKAGLNRAILNAGWHWFAAILTDKTEERGGQVATVPAWFTSQTCAACGMADASSRESQARFTCIGCGHTDHADVDASVNIERRWSAPLFDVEGVHRQPCEASTGRGLTISENPRPSGRGRC